MLFLHLFPCLYYRDGFFWRCDKRIWGTAHPSIYHRTFADPLIHCVQRKLKCTVSRSFLFQMSLTQIILTNWPTPVLSLASAPGTPLVLQTPIASNFSLHFWSAKQKRITNFTGNIKLDFHGYGSLVQWVRQMFVPSSCVVFL